MRTLADLKAIEQKIRNELGLFLPDPRLYSFSALFDLFSAMESRLSKKNRLRLTAWQDEADMTAYCNANSRKFREEFTNRLAKRHFDLLVASHLAKLLSMTRSMDKTAGMTRQVLIAKEQDQDLAREKINRVRKNGLRLKNIVDNSVEGAVSGLGKRDKDPSGKGLF